MTDIDVTGPAPAAAAEASRSGPRGDWMMWACCLAMVAGAAVLLLSRPEGQGPDEALLLALPLVGCLAMHLVLHRLTGRSCHGGSDSKENDR